MIGPKDFTTLKAENLMQDVVSFYRNDAMGHKLAMAMTEGWFWEHSHCGPTWQIGRNHE